MGVYMNVKASYEAWKSGWDATMANAWTEGRETFPDGIANFHYATFEYFGRGCFEGCGGEGHGIFMTAPQSRITIRGCTVENPLSGSTKTTEETLFTNLANRQVVFVDNVWWGMTSRFGPTGGDVTHLVRNNLFLGDSSGMACSTGRMSEGSAVNGVCPASKMVQFEGDAGRLVVKHNFFGGHAIGAWLSSSRINSQNETRVLKGRQLRMVLGGWLERRTNECVDGNTTLPRLLDRRVDLTRLRQPLRLGGQHRDGQLRRV